MLLLVRDCCLIFFIKSCFACKIVFSCYIMVSKWFSAIHGGLWLFRRLIEYNWGCPHFSPLCNEKYPDFPIYGEFSPSEKKCHIMLKFEKIMLKRLDKTFSQA